MKNYIVSLSFEVHECLSLKEARQQFLEVVTDNRFTSEAWSIKPVEEKQENFPITSVSREDLESIGYDTSKVDDEDMRQLASKMSDAYCDNGFWIDLPILADHLEIPKHKK